MLNSCYTIAYELDFVLKLNLKFSLMFLFLDKFETVVVLVKWRILYLMVTDQLLSLTSLSLLGTVGPVNKWKKKTIFKWS